MSWSPFFAPTATMLARAQSDRVMITADELKVANGVDSDKIWLSMAGNIYDVTEGKTFYGPGGPYHVFSGRDAPVPYVTGVFTEEEAAKSWRVLEPHQLKELKHWLSFYKDKPDKYPQVGYLIGRFYTEDGVATKERSEFINAVLQANNEEAHDGTEL